MKHFVTVLISALVATGAAAVASADSNSNAVARAKTLTPTRVSASQQPNGKPTKVSAFAPRSGGSHQHVYGAPIQAPIFHSQPKKKPAPK
jgi:hypothetical protein